MPEHLQFAIIGRPYRYTGAATNEPGRYLFSGLAGVRTRTGCEERCESGPGVFCSEVGVAPPVSGTR